MRQGMIAFFFFFFESPKSLESMENLRRKVDARVDQIKQKYEDLSPADADILDTFNDINLEEEDARVFFDYVCILLQDDPEYYLTINVNSFPLPETWEEYLHIRNRMITLCKARSNPSERGRRLKEYRKKAGLTGKEVSNKWNENLSNPLFQNVRKISQSAVSHLEIGRIKRLRLCELVQYALIYNDQTLTSFFNDVMFGYPFSEMLAITAGNSPIPQPDSSLLQEAETVYFDVQNEKIVKNEPKQMSFFMNYVSSDKKCEPALSSNVQETSFPADRSALISWVKQNLELLDDSELLQIISWLIKHNTMK